MNRVIVAAVIAITLSAAMSAQAQNTVTFDNQSGEPALVKLIGPTATEVQVPNETKEKVNASAGRYTIKVRYGVPGRYRYSKGQEFEVKETASTASAITITLHKVVAGNYDSRPITEKEFEEPSKQTNDRSAASTGQGQAASAAGRTDGTTTPKAEQTIPVLIEAPGGLAAAKCNDDGALIVTGGPHAGRYLIRDLKEIHLAWEQGDAKPLSVDLLWPDGRKLHIEMKKENSTMNLPALTGLSYRSPNARRLLTSMTRLQVGATGKSTWMPPIPPGTIPPPPKFAQDAQVFAVYDPIFIKDDKQDCYGIVVRVWARHAEAFKEPGLKPTFLTFSAPATGELGAMETVGTFAFGGGGLSWNFTTKSGVGGAAEQIRASGHWEGLCCALAMGFGKSSLEAKHLGFMLHDKDFHPASNILFFSPESFKLGDINAEFQRLNKQIDDLGPK